MRRVLIMSSHVAVSRVGGFAQALALATLGVDGILAPTVLFGRHPGWGPPGGNAVDPVVFRGVLTGIEAQLPTVTIDAVITGYFSHPDQVTAAAEAIDRLRHFPHRAPLFVLVDPVLGDEGRGLYVKPDVARAVVEQLLPRADLLTPNLWELGHLAGQQVATREQAIAVARTFPCPVMVTSAPLGKDRTGVLLVREERGWQFSHGVRGPAPNGTGDLLSALMVAAVLDGLSPPEATCRAVAGVLDALDAASEDVSSDLPIVRLGPGFRHPVAEVTVETL